MVRDKTQSSEGPIRGNKSINRRHLLKTMGATSVTIGMGILSTTTASANQALEYQVDELTSKEKSQITAEVKSAKGPYNSRKDAEKAIQTYGKQVLSELSQQGVISNPSLPEFKINEISSFSTYVETREGMGITGFLYEDVPTAHIYVSKEIRDQHVSIVVEPQAKRSYAIIQSTNNPDSVTVIDSSDDISPNAASTNNDSTDVVTIQALRAGQYCLHDNSNTDPTGDPCLLQCESYDFYCSYRGDENINGCYISGRTGCCDNPCLNTGRPCVYGVKCSYCKENDPC